MALFRKLFERPSYFLFNQNATWHFDTCKRITDFYETPKLSDGKE